MTTTANPDQAVINQYTGADPGAVPAELRAIIEAAIMHHPRSLQVALGPSELGVTCDRCLAHMLAGTPEHPEAAWLPTIGTAVHEWLEAVMIRHEQTRATLGLPGRYLAESRVAVGIMGGETISGNTDVFDTHTGTCVDWKIVGVTTLRSVKGNGASAQYRHQGNLYGKGWEDAGYTVKSILIYFLPRNAQTLADAVPFQFDYDRADALATLARADTLANLIHDVGLTEVLAGLPPHDFTGFSCKRYALPSESITNSSNPSDPFGS